MTMWRSGVWRVLAAVSRWSVVAACLLGCVPAAAGAQELEPGAYWPLPIGTNILTAINNLNWGDLAFEPSGPIDHASATINTAALAYTRVLNVAGRPANVGALLPIVGGHLEGRYFGAPAEADRFGLGDPRLRFAINLYGARAMTPREFASYRLRTIIGVSLVVAPPLGQYNHLKLVNIGTNRWSFKPELGLAHAYGRWVVELMVGAWLFTDNTDFVGVTREQAPIGTVQAHLTYRWPGGMWLAGDATYYSGGRTTLDGRHNADVQRNSRVGLTFSKALTRRHSIRLALSQGAYTTIGGDFTTIAVGYNYAWAR